MSLAGQSLSTMVVAWRPLALRADVSERNVNAAGLRGD